jgi:hypothetical protein
MPSAEDLKHELFQMMAEALLAPACLRDDRAFGGQIRGSRGLHAVIFHVLDRLGAPLHLREGRTHATRASRRRESSGHF